MWSAHLFEDEKSHLPEKLNTWESATITEEFGRDGFAAWLRNKERQLWALCVPYLIAAVWKGCYPDFLVCRRQRGDVVVDIVDPYLTSVEDAPAKAAALATYADDHQDHFGRIDLIVVDKQGTSEERVKRLSLMNEKVRKKVRGVTTNQHLRDLFDYEG